MTLALVQAGEVVRCKVPTCKVIICTLIDNEIRVRIKMQSVSVREAKSVSVICEHGHINDFRLTEQKISA